MRYLLLILLIGCHCGCESLLKSRYAMDDPIYALKYGEGAERGDLLGKAKQAMDARHTEGLWGNYFSGGAQVRPDSSTAMGGAELGAEGHATSWLTGRAALAIYGAHNEGYAGGDVGVRIQTPSRIAPFVGIGTFQGFSRGVELADDDWLDNDDDGWIDEKGEKDVFCDGYLATIYPEVGVHAWLNGNWRITSYGRYLITSEGRDYDDWLIGLQVTGFRR